MSNQPKFNRIPPIIHSNKLAWEFIKQQNIDN
jgi:hypothetical protein